MSRRVLAVLFAMSLLVAACGGEGGSDTTSAPADEGTDTTSVAVDTTEAGSDDEGPGIGLTDIPQECIDLLAEYLRAIEPVVAEVDWENAGMEDLEQAGTELEDASAEYETALEEEDCDELNVEASDEESFQFMLDLAEQEAPGTIAYLALLQGLAGDFAEGSDIDISGDCETDISTLQGIVDQGGTMEDMSIADVGSITGLITAISANCDADRVSEFFAQEDIANFMGG